MSGSKAGGAELQVAQLKTMSERHPDEIGYRVVGAGHLTFSQWEHESNRFARGLNAAGVRHGDRIAIQLNGNNALRWVTAYAAIHKVGASVVPLDPRLAPAEVARMLSHAGVVVVVADAERVDSALLALSDGSRDPTSLALVVDASLHDSTSVMASDVGIAPERCVSWDEILDDDGSGYQVPVDEDDLSDILFTSGTTGHPKGVAVRHSNASTVPYASPTWSGHLWFHASPLATFAGVSFVYSPMKLGMTSVYQPRFDAGEWLEFVESEAPRAVFLVPAMVQLILGHPHFDHADLSSVGVCAVGSAPLAPAAINRLQERMPDALVSNNYGMTEAGSVYCMMPKGEAVRRPGSVGKPLPPAEVRCVDSDGADMATGEYGEVQLRSPGRQREYFEDPEATAETWIEGWLRTGDIGRLDEDGYLYIGGRMKDVIIRGGSNVYAVDVEHIILAHPGVSEIAVIGVPHDVLGEDVAAVVVARPGWDIDAESLRQHCLLSLAAYKVPRTWAFMDQLPRNAAGKVLKNEVRAWFADTQSDTDSQSDADSQSVR